MKAFIKTAAIIFALVWAIIAISTVASLAQSVDTPNGATCRTYDGTEIGVSSPRVIKTVRYSKRTYKAFQAERATLQRDSNGMAIIGHDGKPLKKGQALPSAAGFAVEVEPLTPQSFRRGRGADGATPRP